MELEQVGNWIRLTRGNNCDPLVDYVVLAEFDIDTGSTVREIYPNGAVPGYKNDWFADYMLPEGAHNRDVDYTYIFLNRNESQIDEDLWTLPKNPYLDKNMKHNVELKGKNNDNFLYGINLVKTKHDLTVRRGAIVKAICVFSRYHYVEIFKKPLDMALEKYFETQSSSILSNLFDTLNSIDISHLPKPDYLEQCLMRRGIHYDSLLQTVPKHNRSKLWNKSIKYSFYDSEKALIFPIYRTPDEVGDINVSLLVKTFGESVMKIFHAILTKQRILFVGYNHSAADVAQFVLSAVALVAPSITKIIRRTFPYANLSDLSFLDVSGYISGVTNPMFQQHDNWWDLLCVLDLPNNTGHIYSSEEKKSDGSDPNKNIPNTKVNISSDDSPHHACDLRFITGVVSGINSSKLSEDWVRQQFYDYTNQIINFAQDVKGIYLNTSKLEEKAKKFMDQNMPRISLIQKSSEFKSLPTHPFVWGMSLDSDNNDISDNIHKTNNDEVLSGKSVKLTMDKVDICDNNNSSTTVEEITEDESETVTTDSLDNNNKNNELNEENIPINELTVNNQSDNNNNQLESSEVMTEGGKENVSENNIDNFDNGYLIKSYVRKLQCESNLNNDTEVQVYFEHLEKRLTSESSLQGLLVLLPESTGSLLPIALGLFNKNPIIRRCAVNIISNVNKYSSTKSAFNNMNTFLLDAYNKQLDKLNCGILLIEEQEMTKRVHDPFEELSNANHNNSNSLIQKTINFINNHNLVTDHNPHFSNTIDEIDLIP